MYSLFSITIHLTELGFDKIDDVLKATFCYIRLLNKDNLLECFNELQQIELNTFRFMSEQDPIDNVEQLICNMKYYPSKHILSGPHLYFEYNMDAIQNVIKYLTGSRNFNVMISKNDIPGIVFNKKEKWFGTEYTTARKFF